MRLNVYIIGVKQLSCTVLRQPFRDIDIFTSAIIPFPRVAFSVFVCQNGPLSFQNRPADNIFGCDEFQAPPLTIFLSLNGLSYFRINLLQIRHALTSWNKILKGPVSTENFTAIVRTSINRSGAR